MNKESRGNFSSKIGVVLATAGSAVGLGNVWRFPYMAGQNGGAAFILIYIGFVFLLGIPGMVCEFIVGRNAHTNAARSYAKLGGKTPFAWAGIIGLFASMCILGFYSVVAGWCLHYFYASMTGGLKGDSTAVAEYFQNFSSSAVAPAALSVLFVLLTHFVVAKGVKSGIEKASKLLMPLLFIFLIVIIIASCSLPGASEGIKFLFHPDFSKIDRTVLLAALGQAFFSLSLGAACLCTYASYFDKGVNLLQSASQIALVDTLIAILAGLMIFPAAFSVGVSPDSGPSLIFITLPNVFNQAFGNMPIIGYIVSVMFYALLVLAALTSTISMHEIGTAFFHEELNISRGNAAWITTAICSIIGVLCALSVGNGSLSLFGKSILDFLDFLTAQILLPLVAMLTCLLVGWYVPKDIVWREFTNRGTLRGTLFVIFYFCARVVCPLCILMIFLDQLHII